MYSVEFISVVDTPDLVKRHSISGSGSPTAVQLILKFDPVTEVIETGVGCCVNVGGTKKE